MQEINSISIEDPKPTQINTTALESSNANAVENKHTETNDPTLVDDAAPDDEVTLRRKRISTKIKLAISRFRYCTLFEQFVMHFQTIN